MRKYRVELQVGWRIFGRTLPLAIRARDEAHARQQALEAFPGSKIVRVMEVA